MHPPDNPQTKTQQQDYRQKISLLSYLTVAICLCATPGILVSIYLGFSQIQGWQKQIDQEARKLVEDITTRIDTQIESHVKALELLGISSLLDDTTRLDAFYREAQGFYQIYGTHVILSDISLQMLVNTRSAMGANLPKLPPSATPRGRRSAVMALETGRPAIGDIVFGPVANQRLVAVAVPVKRDNEIKFILLNTFDTARLQRSLDEMVIPEGQIVTILDAQGQTVARRPAKSDGDIEIGSLPNTFVSRSSLTSWSFLLSIPNHLYYAWVKRLAIWLIIIFFVSTAAILVGARMVARRISDSIEQLALASSNLPSEKIFTEVDKVRTQLVNSQKAMDQALSELRKSEDRLRLAQDAAKSGTWEWYLRTNENFWSDELWPLYGLQPHSCEPKYENWVLTIHPDDRAEAERKVKAAASNLDELNAEWRIIDPDGRERWLMSRGRPVHEPDGQASSYTGIVIDITDRKQMEQEILLHKENLEKLVGERTRELTENRNLLYTITNNLPVGIYYIDPDERYVFTNVTYCSWWARTGEEIVGKTARELMEDGYEKAGQLIKLCLSGQEIVREGNFKYADGVTRDLWVRFVPDRGNDGEIKGVVALLVDISGLKKMERQLQEAERKKYRDLAELIPSPVFECDLEGKFTFGNSAAVGLTQVSEDEFLAGFGPIQIVIPEDRDRVTRDIQSLLGGQESVTNNFTFLRKDGLTVPCLVHATPIWTLEKIVGIRGVMIDIGTLRRAELERDQLKQQLFESQKLASLATLVGGIAHDFNNMLQVIIGNGEMLMFDIEGKADTRRLTTILQTSEEAAELVKKFMALGQQSMVIPKPINLNDKIKELESLILHLPNIDHLEMDLVSRPAFIKQDPDQLGQIIMNLAMNASEAMRDGGKLSLKTARVIVDDDLCRGHVGLSPGSYVLLTVTDTGRGMDEVTLPRIFDPFFSTKERGNIKGMGLGLSVVRGIVQQRGGFITCESVLGKGTTFRIYFPEIEIPVTPDIPETAICQVSCGATVLIVEDSTLVSVLEETALNTAGYKTILAANGKEAVNIYKERHDEIGLVILDIIMPEMNGRECLMELLKINPLVKVIVLSGHDPKSELSIAVKPYVISFLPKPCKMSQLVEVVQLVMEG